jgi:hypothetical protein
MQTTTVNTTTDHNKNCHVAAVITNSNPQVTVRDDWSILIHALSVTRGAAYRKRRHLRIPGFIQCSVKTVCKPAIIRRSSQYFLWQFCLWGQNFEGFRLPNNIWGHQRESSKSTFSNENAPLQNQVCVVRFIVGMNLKNQKQRKNENKPVTKTLHFTYAKVRHASMIATAFGAL